MTNKKLIYLSKESEEESMDGANMLNVEIFRVGEFKGHEFTRKDLKEMVANFLYLRKEGILPNVPVRADHPGLFGGGSVDKIIGYFEDLYMKGEKLVADLRITEPDAMEKIKRGTYRSRSSEIGYYVDNSGDEFYPAIMGVAFVDLPAVEGLDDNYVAQFSHDMNSEVLNMEEFAAWNRKLINQLPDSAFAVIEPAYKKGDTRDKNARHLPFKGKDGEVDLPHLRNALARVNKIRPVTDSIDAKDLRANALKVLSKYRSLLKEESENAYAWWDNQIESIMRFNQLTEEDMENSEGMKEGVAPSEEVKPEEAEVTAEEEVKEEAPSEEAPSLEAEEEKPSEETEAEESKEGSGESEETEGEKEGAEMSLDSAGEPVQLSRAEYNSLISLKEENRKISFGAELTEMLQAGKTTPATKEAELSFMMSLDESQLKAYREIKKEQPKFFTLGDGTEVPEPEKALSEEGAKPSETEAEEEADAFLEQTK